MGKRGPAPKPARLRLLDGARADKLPKNAPVARSGDITPPEHLSEPVRAIFERVVSDLQDMQIASPVDADSIVAYCEAVQRHREASTLLARSPVLITGQKGNLVMNPALRVQRDAATLIRMFAQEFGLTPSARVRIDSERNRQDNDNPFSGTG